MKKLLFIIIALLCFFDDAHAIRIKKTPECFIVHESAGQNTVHNFLEDVLFLLPTDLSTLLAKNYDQLQGSVRVSVPNNYWQHKVLDEKQFKELYRGIVLQYSTSKSDTALVRSLGKTISDILEIAMLPNGFDPLNEKLRGNLSQFMNTSHANTYLINAEIYKNHSFDAQVRKLYELRRCNKDNIYPDLVNITANLWTAVWVAAGHSDTIVPQVFIRRPFQLVANLKPWRSVEDTTGRFSEIRDPREALMLLDAWSNNSYSVENRIMTKRIAENIQAQRIQQEAEYEYQKYRAAKGIRDDLLVIDTDDLLAAISQQRIAQGISTSISVGCSLAAVPREACDSLERCLLK